MQFEKDYSLFQKYLKRVLKTLVNPQVYPSFILWASEAPEFFQPAMPKRASSSTLHSHPLAIPGPFVDSEENTDRQVLGERGRQTQGWLVSCPSVADRKTRRGFGLIDYTFILIAWLSVSTETNAARRARACLGPENPSQYPSISCLGPERCRRPRETSCTGCLPFELQLYHNAQQRPMRTESQP